MAENVYVCLITMARALLFTLVARSTTDAVLVEAGDRLQPHKPPRFNCSNVTIPPTPTNVRQLHPGHVRYVIALGDSITAVGHTSGVARRVGQ